MQLLICVWLKIYALLCAGNSVIIMWHQPCIWCPQFPFLVSHFKATSTTTVTNTTQAWKKRPLLNVYIVRRIILLREEYHVLGYRMSKDICSSLNGFCVPSKSPLHRTKQWNQHIMVGYLRNVSTKNSLYVSRR